MFGASPHSHDAITNSSTLAVNSRTWPKRCVSQPVSGTEIALATANEVMTQVPCAGLTPMSPAIAGIDTLAIDVSSTFMNVASDSAIVPSTRCAALERRERRGRARPGGAAAGGAARVRGGASAAAMRRHGAVERAGLLRPARRRAHARRGPPAAGAGAAARARPAPAIASRWRRLQRAAVGRDDAAHVGVGRASSCGRTTAVCDAGGRAARRPACAPSVLLTSTFASIDRPTRSGCAASSLASSAMRTGTRCTTLIQLPVAFCAGSSAKAAPVPAPRPATRPWYSTLLPYTSACSSTGWPMRRLLQLALLEVGLDPDLVERDHRHQRRAGLHALAELHAALGDVAVDRRQQLGALQRQVGLAHARRGAQHVRVLLDRGAFGQRLVRRAAARAPPARADCAAATLLLRRGAAARSTWLNSSLPTAPVATSGARRVDVVLRARRRRLCARARSASRRRSAPAACCCWHTACAPRARSAPAAPRPGRARPARRPGRACTSTWPALTWSVSSA